ncbi:hypothetical protein Dda_8915 [Drechslerella dactyloides]|uniref:PLOD1-3-like GT domain-containing protein n=1 Tax=Drechslerella dactyloides TaxID=74499 RepID=A0AAD6IRA3_DREDA|nr:hypothetical protein Dda_8915 [Drechslerella dactyloides]
MYPQGYCAAVFGHRRGKIVFGAIFLSLLGLLFMHTSHPTYLTNLAQPWLHPSVSSNDLTLFNTNEFDRRIHLLIPVTAPNAKFCKTFFSALANAYPPPFLINYGEVFRSQAVARAMKIKGFHTYLNERTRDDDIVIMIDGFDVWFQLPLQILLARFIKLGVPAVFGADKKCWPNDFKSVACTAVPQSPLPPDVFGDDTDRQTIMRGGRDKYDNFRPRWVNSGTIIGYAAHVRSIYDEAWAKVEAAGEVNSDQLILAEVYGDRIVKGDKSMTVDFYSSLFQTMTYSHNDLAFIRNPSEELTSTTFSKEISNEKLPLEDLGLSATKSPNPNRSPWKWRSLAWNKVSNRIPTLLHFNGPKYFIDIWWPRMWYYNFGVRWTARFKEEPMRAGAWVAGKEPGTLAWLTYESVCGKERLFGEPEQPKEGEKPAENKPANP